MNSMPIELKDAIDLMKKCLHEQTLTSFKYYLWGLYLEFGELDDNNRWEFAFQIFPSWKFQANYRLKHHSDMEKEEIKSWLTQ